MSVTPDNLIAYASLNMPVDDVSPSGGDINLKRRVIFTPLAANDRIEIRSTSPLDIQDCTVSGRIVDASIDTTVLALTGTVARAWPATYERLESVTMASDAVGDVYVSRIAGGPPIAVIPAGERGFQRMFIDASSVPSADKFFYEKFFLKNASATDLTEATVEQHLDPEGVITTALALALNDTVQVANRLTAPPTITFDDTVKDVPGGTLAAGEAIGVWMKAGYLAGTAGFKSHYHAELSGATV